jgi:hypothetical protein
MRAIFLAIALFFHGAVTAYDTDFDSVIVGSSPISLLEALYHSYSGERVCIIEESNTCGGAWKSIPICGIPYADMGCHQIGSDHNVRKFLEEYLGCNLVSLDHPEVAFDASPGHNANGFYPSKGCHELITNIMNLIKTTDIVVLTGHKLDSVYIDEESKTVELRTAGLCMTTSRIVVTPSTYLNIENHPSGRKPSKSTIKYYHVYLLVEDPTTPRFIHKYSAGAGISRLMNLTYFSDLIGTGMQLIAVQTHNEEYLTHHEEFFEQIKKRDLIDPDATLIQAEACIYEQAHLDTSLVKQYQSSLIEVLNTGHFLAMSGYIAKWKTVFKPLIETSR